MNIGLYVTSLTPKGASQARFQSSVFEGLLTRNAGRHKFVILTHEVPSGFKNTPDLEYVTLRQNQGPGFVGTSIKRLLFRWGSFFCKCLGERGGEAGDRLRNWAYPEPAYYEQLRELQIRLIWFVTGHELPSWLPFVKTVWDVNQRIHSMYPEFSYTRFTFDGLDRPLSMIKASYVIVGTEEGKRQIVSMFGVYEPKVRVIPFPTPSLPNGDGVQALKLDVNSDAPYVFFPARFWPHKNHVVVVAALRVLRDKWNITMNLVFCGADEGNLAYILEYAETLGVRRQVTYLGEVSDLELASLYRGALALTFVAAVGPDNLPPLEAMSLGCPAIVADVPGAREQFGDACLFFAPCDEVALAGEIKLLLDEPATRDALVVKGLERAKRWTVQDYASQVVSIFDEFELIARAWGANDASFS